MKIANLRCHIILFITCIVLLTTLFPPNHIGFAQTSTVEELADITIQYYEKEKPGLDHFEELDALFTAGVNLNEGPWENNLEYWETPALTYAGTILALLALGDDPTCVWDEQRNLLEELKNKQQDDGSFGNALNDTVWAMIALDAAGDSYEVSYDEKKALEFVVNAQDNSGGFGFWGEPGPDDTGMALRALSNHRDKDGVNTAITAAVQYLKDIQSEDTAGFASWGTENSNSIAAVISGLLSVGEDITGEDWVKNDRTMIDALFNFRLDDGSFYWAETEYTGKETDYMATRQALRALADLVNVGKGQYAADSEETVADAVYQAVYFYQGQKYGLDHFEELDALFTAGVNLNEGPWENNLEYWETPALTYAGTILALLALEDDPTCAWEEQRDLPEELTNKQQGDGSFGKALNDTVWAIIALDAAGGSYDENKAVEFVVNTQDDSGGFDFSGYGTGPDDTGMALRALSNHRDKEGVNAAIAAAMQYLKDIQSEDTAGFASWGTENSNSIAAVISGLLSIGEDITGGDWVKNDRTMIDALFNFRLDDGSFYWAETEYTGKETDHYATRQGLRALADLINAGQGDYIPVYTPAQNGSGGDNGVTPPPGSVITVYVEVVGRETTYFKGDVSIDPQNANVLEALHQTGLSYRTRDGGHYVYEIAGEREEISTTAGWKYQVNGNEPGTSAKSCSVKDGDQVIWFWASDAGAGIGGPTTPSGGKKGGGISEKIPVLSEEKLRVIISFFSEQPAYLHENLKKLPVEIVLDRVIVLGGDEPMSAEEKEVLQEQLESNIVNLFFLLQSLDDFLITDDLGEIILHVDAGSLVEETEITVEEIAADTLPAVPTHTVVSPVYRLGPKGTVFKKPLTFSIRMAIPEGMDPAGLTVAWLDEEKGQWYALPTVVDLSSGYVSALVEHFTPFTVLSRQQEFLPFSDITAENWAYTPVHYLAARGIVCGVGEGRFQPDRNVTRAEFATMLANALGLEAGADLKYSFEDVDPQAWYAASVKAAAAAGIVKGVSATAFHPNDNITREQMSVMISSVPFASGAEGDFTVTFADMDTVSSWAREGVKNAAVRELVQGFPDGSFRPRETLTRAQAAAAIYRLLLP